MDQTSSNPEGETLKTENDTTSSPAAQPVAATQTAEGHSPTLMGVLAYIGPLVLIPYFLAKDDAFVRFHVKQGLVLVVIELVLWVLGEMMFWYFLAPVIMIVNLVLLVLSIIGIMNVLQKKEARLPLVGAYSDHFKV